MDFYRNSSRESHSKEEHTDVNIQTPKSHRRKGMYNIAVHKYAGCDIKAIVKAMREEQREHTFDHMSESYIKYRKVVAEWMFDVCTYFNLHATTTHAAIAYLDRLQPNENFTRHEWQMLAVCCISISSKYNECEEHVPDLATLEEITQHKISNETLLNYELWALKKMSWRINARTPLSFVASYIEYGVYIPGAGDISKEFTDSASIEEALAREAYALSASCMLDRRLKKYVASDVAGAIIYWTRRTLHVEPTWNVALQELTHFDPYPQEDSNNAQSQADIMMFLEEIVRGGGNVPQSPKSSEPSENDENTDPRQSRGLTTPEAQGRTKASEDDGNSDADNEEELKAFSTPAESGPLARALNDSTDSTDADGGEMLYRHIDDLVATSTINSNNQTDSPEAFESQSESKTSSFPSSTAATHKTVPYFKKSPLSVANLEEAGYQGEGDSGGIDVEKGGLNCATCGGSVATPTTSALDTVRRSIA